MLDLHLGAESGLTLLARLKALTPEFRAVVLAGASAPEPGTEAKRLGVVCSTRIIGSYFSRCARTPMATVDLVFASDCPNVGLARVNLLLAFSRAGMMPRWSERLIGDPEAPAHTRGYGSPTILVDGRDVAGLPPSAEGSCRIYQGASGWVQAPTPDQIAAALTSTAPMPAR